MKPKEINNQIREFLKYFQEYDLSGWLPGYGEEDVVGKRLLTEMIKIKQNDYSYSLAGFEGNDYEKFCTLKLLEDLGFIEWGTSSRHGWVPRDNRVIFDMLLILLAEDPYNINLQIEYEDDGDEIIEQFNYKDDTHVLFLKEKLKDYFLIN